MDNEEKPKKLDIGRELAAAFLKKKHGTNAQNRKKKAEKLAQEQGIDSKTNAKEQPQYMLLESFQMKELENCEGTDLQNEQMTTSRSVVVPTEENDLHVLTRLQTRIKELEDIVEGKAALEAARLQLDAQNELQLKAKTCDSCSTHEGCGAQFRIEEFNNKMLEYKAALEQRDSYIQKLSNSLKDALSTRDELQLKGEHLAQEVASLNQQLQSTKELIQTQQRTTEIRSDDFELLKNQKISLVNEIQSKDLIISNLNKTILENENALKIREMELHKKCVELNDEKTRTAEEIRNLMKTVEAEHKAKAAALFKLESLEGLHEAAISDLRIKMEETFGLQLVQIKEELRLQFEKEKQIYCDSLNSKSIVEHCNQNRCQELKRQNELLQKKVDDYNLKLRAFEENIESLNLSHCSVAESELPMQQDEIERKELKVQSTRPFHNVVNPRSEMSLIIEGEHSRKEEGESKVIVWRPKSSSSVLNDTNMKEKQILLKVLECQVEIKPLSEHLRRISSLCINVSSLIQKYQKNRQLVNMLKENCSDWQAGQDGICVDSSQPDILIYNKGDAVIELEKDLHWITNVNAATQEAKSSNSSTEMFCSDHTQTNTCEDVIEHLLECSLEKCVDMLHMNDLEGEIIRLKNNLKCLNTFSSELESKLNLATEFFNRANKEECAVQHLTEQGLIAAREEIESELKHYIHKLENNLSDVQVKLNETETENLNLKLIISCVSNINKKVKQEGFNTFLFKEVKQVFQHIDELFSDNTHICVDHTQFSHLFQERYTEQLLKRIQDLENTLQQVNEESDNIKQESVKMISKVTQAKEMSDKLQNEMRSLKEDNSSLRQANDHLAAEINSKEKQLNSLQFELQSVKLEFDSYRPHTSSREGDGMSKFGTLGPFDNGVEVKPDITKSSNYTESVSRWIQYLKLGDDYRKLCRENNDLNNEIQKLKLKINKLNNCKCVLEDKVKMLDEDLHSNLQKFLKHDESIQNIMKDKMELENKICLLEHVNTSLEEKISENRRETVERLLKIEAQISNLSGKLAENKILSYNYITNVLMESYKNIQEIVVLKEKFFIQEHTISRLHKELELLQKLNTEKNHGFQTLHNELLLLHRKLESSFIENQAKEKEIETIRNELTLHLVCEDRFEAERRKYLDSNKAVEDILGSLVNGEVKRIVEELGEEIIKLRQTHENGKSVSEDLQQQDKFKNFDHALQRIIDTGLLLQEKLELLINNNEQLITEKESLFTSLCSQQYLEQLQAVPDSNKNDTWFALLHGYQNEVIAELTTYRNQNSAVKYILETVHTMHETLNAQKDKLLWTIQNKGASEDNLHQEYKERKKLELELQLLKTEMSGRESIQVVLRNEKQNLEAELKEVYNHLEKEKEKQRQQKIVFDAEICSRDLCIQRWQVECKALEVLSQTSAFDEYLKFVSSTDILTWHYLEQQKLDSLYQKLQATHSSEISKWKKCLQEQINICHCEAEHAEKEQPYSIIDSEIASMTQIPLSNTLEPLFQKEVQSKCQGEKLNDPNILLEQFFRQFQHIICAYYSSMVKKLIGDGMKCEEEKINKITQEIETLQKDECAAILNIHVDDTKNSDLVSVQGSIHNSLKAKETILAGLKHFHDQFSANYLEQINTLCSSLSNLYSKIVKDTKNIQNFYEESELVRQLKEQLENLEKEKMELQETHRCAVDLLSHEHDVEISKLRDLIVGIKCEDSSALNEVRQELEAKYTKEVEELRQYFEQKVAEVEKHYSEEIVSQHSRKMSTSSCDSESELVSDMYYCGAGDHGSRLPPLTHVCDRYVVEPSYRELDENVELNSEKTHLTDYHNQLKAVQRELKANYFAETEILKKDYEAKVESVVRDLSTTHQNEIRCLEMKYEKQLQESNLQSGAQIQNLKAMHETILASETEKHEKEIAIFKRKNDEEITSLKKHVVESSKKRAVYLTSVLHKCFEKYFATMKSLFEVQKKWINLLCDDVQKNEMQHDLICNSQIHYAVETSGECISKELDLNSEVSVGSGENKDNFEGEKEFIAAILHQFETNFANCRKFLETEISLLCDEIQKQKKHDCQQLEDKHRNELEPLMHEINELKKEINNGKHQTVHNVLQQTDLMKTDADTELAETSSCHKKAISSYHMEGLNIIVPDRHEDCVSGPVSECKEGINKIRERYETLINQLQSEFQQKENSHVRTVSEIKRMHECEVETLKVEFDRRLHDEVEHAKHEIFKDLEEQIQALLASDDNTPKPKELVLLQDKLTVPYQREIQEIKEKYTSEIEKIKLEYEKVIEELKAKCLSNLQVEKIEWSIVDDIKDTSSNGICPNTGSYYESEILRSERDSLRKMGEKLRYLIEELVQYCNVCEEEINYAVVEKLIQKQKVNESNDIDINEQSLLIGTSHLTSADTDLSAHSLCHTSNLETSSEQYNSECGSDSETKQSFQANCTEIQDLPIIRKVHFAPNISSIVNLHDESSFMQFVENNKDWSANIRNELNSCLRRLRKEASALFGLSATLPEHLNAANNKAKSLEDKVTVLTEELSSENQEKERLVEKINELITKNESLMKDLDACKIQINELETERQTKEFVSEGVGENIHSPLTRQMENLAKLQDKARSVLSEAADQRNSPHMHLLEELCREGDRLTEEARKEREDLQLQLESLELQLKEANALHEEQSNKKEELESELKAAVDKIWVLREIITELEHQAEQYSQREAELEQRVESLQAALEQQTQNHQRLAEELHSLQLDSGSIELTQHINHLEEELQKHRLHVEQLQSNSTVIQEMRSQLQELEALVDKKTKDLESLFVTTCSISCSSPSEDVSIREQIDSLRCDTPDDIACSETPLMLPLDELNRLQEKFLRHSKTDDVALKRVHDLEMQLQAVRRNEEEVVAERDLLQEKVEQQLIKISSLESLRDEHRRTVKNIQEKASIELQSKIYDTENNMRILKETLNEKDSEVKDLKATLENMKQALTLQEKEWMKKLSAECEKLLTLQVQTEKLLQEKKQLQVSLSEHVNEMNTSIPELLSAVLCEKNTEIDILIQQLADLQKQILEHECAKQGQQSEDVKSDARTELPGLDADQKVLLEEVDEMRECEEPTFINNTASFQAHLSEMHKPLNLGNESSSIMKQCLELPLIEEFRIETPVPNLSAHENSEELLADRILVPTISGGKLNSISTSPESTEVTVNMANTDHRALCANEQSKTQFGKEEVFSSNTKLFLTEKMKQTVRSLKQDLKRKNDRLLEYQKKLEEMSMIREEKQMLESQLINAIQEIGNERSNFQQEKQVLKENEFKLKCEITNFKTLIDEKQSEINYLKGIIISKDEIIKQLEEDNKIMFTPGESISHKLTETKELNVLLSQLKEEQESVKTLKVEVNRLQELNGKIINEYNTLRKDLEKHDANSLDDLTGRVEKELDLSAQLDSSLLEKLEPLERICKCNDPSFAGVIGKILNFGADMLSLEELSFLRQLALSSDILKEQTSTGMLSAANITAPANTVMFHERNSENFSKQLSQLHQQKVEHLESAVEAGKKQVMELLESLNKQKACSIELEKKVNDLMRLQTECEMENENLKRQTLYHEERLQQFIVLLEKERVKVRDFENDLHKERNNVQHLQSLLETERQRASDTNRKDSELIESMRIKLENALDNEMRLRIQFDQAISNQEALKSKLKCQQLKIETGAVSRDSSAVITLKDKCAKLETVVRQEQRKIIHLQTALEEERLVWQQKLDSEKSVIQQLRTDVVILKTQRDRLENQIHAAQEQIATYKMDVEVLRKKVRLLQESEISSQRRYVSVCQEADKARRLLEHAHSLQLELERKVVTLENQLCAGTNEGNGEELAQLQHENAELHRLLSASRIHASELSRQLKAADTGKDVPQPVLLKLKSVNTTLEKHVNDNAELTQKLSQLLEERQKLQSKISDMHLQLQKVIRQFQVSELEKKNIDGKFTTERAAWAQERNALHLALAQAKAEIEIPVGAEAMKDTEQRVNHLFGKYLRAESFRKSLIWQKRYLLVVLDGYENTESSTIKKLTELRKSMTYEGPALNRQNKRPRTSFKSAAFVVVAIHRMKYLVTRWKYGRLIGGNTILGRAYSESVIGASAYHGPRRWGSTTSSNIWGTSHSQGVQSPPSRDSPILPHWQLNRVPSHAASLPEGANQVLEYIDRFDTIQQQLGLGIPRRS